jgi:3'(2'), 5'-bisphosphate nucleotidase
MPMYQIAIKSALEAGEAILDIYGQDFEVEFKADQSPLTTADKAAHDIIVRALETTPYPVLSEESTDIPYVDRKGWSTYWLVDPLDGTKEFIKKNGEFTVNIALIHDGVPVFGVVYAPVLDVLYCGMTEEGSGKWDAECRMLDVGCGTNAWKAKDCSGRNVEELIKSTIPLSISSVSPSTTRNEAPLRVVASKSHCNDETREFIAALEEEFGKVELVSRGSSLKLCMVADGSADVYPRIAPTMEWDTGAAHAVVAAAGGQVFEFDPAVPAASYLCGKSDVERRKSDVEGGQADVGSKKHPTSHIPPSTTKREALFPLRYNKENLLNPYFVVSGLHE